jgi:hypothetical protein
MSVAPGVLDLEVTLHLELLMSFDAVGFAPRGRNTPSHSRRPSLKRRGEKEEVVLPSCLRRGVCEAGGVVGACPRRG